jgi:hypothetical protein
MSDVWNGSRSSLYLVASPACVFPILGAGECQGARKIAVAIEGRREDCQSEDGSP